MKEETNMVNPKIALAIDTSTMNRGTFFFFEPLLEHLGNRNSVMPPQSLLFPTTDIALAFAKTPLIGTSPSKSLKDKFRFSKARVSKNFGILPDKLF